MDKLKEMILYVAKKCEKDRKFGLTKLNKILFITDFEQYRQTGESVSGEKYVHRDFGPTPARMLRILESLRRTGKIEITEKDFHGMTQKRVSLIDIEYETSLSEKEQKLLDRVIARTKSSTGKELSEWTHSLPCYQLTQDGEEIPYYTVFLKPQKPLDLAAKAWAKRTMEELGL